MESGPVEKMHAEILLQLGNIFADRRAGQAELTAGFGKAAGLDHLHERPQARHLVQACPSIVADLWTEWL